MAGARQRTFDLIPETLVAQNAPKKAMTLKQAKKAAAAATKGPKISRAERARLEKEELDRQRKERDKLRASEKAKLAREKKALKLAEEKAHRKKMGIPEPSRFVRPSQPTISGFVAAGFKRRRTDTDADADAGADAGTGTRTGEDAGPEHFFENESHTSLIEAEVADEITVPTESELYDDSLGDLDDLDDLDYPGTPEQTVEKQEPNAASKQAPHQGNTSTNLKYPQPTLIVEENLQLAKNDGSASPIRTRTKNNLQDVCKDASEGCEEFDDDAELFAAMAESDVAAGAQSNKIFISTGPLQNTAQKLLEARGLSKSTDRPGSKNLHSSAIPKNMSPPPIQEKRITGTRQLHTEIPRPLVGPNFTNPNTRYQGGMSINAPPQARFPTRDIRQPLSNRPINLPPALPSKRPSYSATAISTPLTKKRVFSTSFPPPSTQAFLSENFDDFFPSPSQEIRELQAEKAKCPVGRNDQIRARPDLPPTRPSFGGKSKTITEENLLLDNLADFFPSPSQEMRDLKEEDEVARRSQVQSSSISSPSPNTPTGHHNVRKSDTSNSNTITVTDKGPTDRSANNKNKPKHRFFIEKEEDLIYAAVTASLQLPKQVTTVTTTEKEQPIQEKLESEKEQPTRKKLESEISRRYSKSSETSDYDDDDLDWDSQDAKLALEIVEGV